MARPMTADDVLPLLASLTSQERVRLLRLISLQSRDDEVAVYDSVPPGHDEFSTDEEPLAWEAEAWEDMD